MEQRNFLYIIGRVYFYLVWMFKPLAVCTENITDDKIWKKIKKKAITRKVLKWYVITPLNYRIFKAFLNLKISKKEFSKRLRRRYLWLIKHDQKLELHVHLSPIMNIKYKEQERLIKKSILWMKKELNINVKEFVPGWWQYNKDTLKILKKYNLKLIKSNKYRFTHDYNWIK